MTFEPLVCFPVLEEHCTSDPDTGLNYINFLSDALSKIPVQELPRLLWSNRNRCYQVAVTLISLHLLFLPFWYGLHTLLFYRKNWLFWERTLTLACLVECKGPCRNYHITEVNAWLRRWCWCEGFGFFDSRWALWAGELLSRDGIHLTWTVKSIFGQPSKEGF